MVLSEKLIAAMISKYIEKDMTLAFGASKHSEKFLTTLALEMEEKEIKVKVVPTSTRIAAILASLKMPIASINDSEIDVAIEFADKVDNGFNYIKRNSTSSVRDKMIAQEAAEYVVVCEEENYGKQLTYDLCLEVCPFAINKTLLQVMSLGDATHKLKENGQPALSETGNHFINVKIDEVYSVEDIEYMTKRIPGVLETSLFVGYADRVILTGNTLTVKSRLTNPELV